jgi:hypothetical protein
MIETKNITLMGGTFALCLNKDDCETFLPYYIAAGPERKNIVVHLLAMAVSIGNWRFPLLDTKKIAETLFQFDPEAATQAVLDLVNAAIGRPPERIVTTPNGERTTMCAYLIQRAE